MRSGPYQQKERGERKKERKEKKNRVCVRERETRKR
jgi:hypothetical protein